MVNISCTTACHQLVVGFCNTRLLYQYSNEIGASGYMADPENAESKPELLRPNLHHPMLPLALTVALDRLMTDLSYIHGPVLI